MSVSGKLSVKKLTSSIWRKNSVEEKGEKWIGKSSSLPNLLDNSSFKKVNKTCAETDGIENGLTIKHDGKIKKSFILKNFTFKSITRRNIDKTSFRTKSSSPTQKDSDGAVRIKHENPYDKYPGSVSTLSLDKDGEKVDDTTQRCLPKLNAAPSGNVHKYQFSSQKIGYISPKKRGLKTKIILPESDSEDNDTFDYVDCSASATGSSLGLTLEDVNSNKTVSIASDSSEFSDTPSCQLLSGRPPARPPKPPELRGEPIDLNRSPKEASESEIPPHPPARQPTTRNFPIIRAVQLMKGNNRESGVYEAIDDKQAFVSECGLPGELRKLPHQPWYWGPLTQEQAEGKLRGLPDGYFLVRDSSDERYLLSLSFNSNGRPVHTRFEYVNGLFSINDSQGYLSVVDLIEDAVQESQNGVYSFMQNINGTQTFPARLTNPVSRFTEMKTLQHLCRFAIRETFPRHYVADLPVPDKIKKYILENQY